MPKKPPYSKKILPTSLTLVITYPDYYNHVQISSILKAITLHDYNTDQLKVDLPNSLLTHYNNRRSSLNLPISSSNSVPAITVDSTFLHMSKQPMVPKDLILSLTPDFNTFNNRQL